MAYITASANAIFAPDGRSVLSDSFDGVCCAKPSKLNDLIHAICVRLLRKLTDEESTLYGIAAHYSTG